MENENASKCARLKLLLVVSTVTLAVFATLLFIGLLAVLHRFRPQSRIVPPAMAYTDGFEVIVALEGAGAGQRQFSSVELVDAEALVQSNVLTSFLIPDAEAAAVEKQLAASARKNGDSSYPFARVRIRPSGEDKQIIEFSWHYSGSTLGYKYEAGAKSIRPLASSFHSLGKRTQTEYAEGVGEQRNN